MSGNLKVMDHWFLAPEPELIVNMESGTFEVKWHHSRHHRVIKRFPREFIDFMDDFIINIYTAPDMEGIELPSDRWHTIAELHAIQRSLIKAGWL